MNDASDIEQLKWKLPPEGFDFGAIFRRLCQTEQNRHRSVKMIRDMSGISTKVDEAFLASHGFGKIRLIEWDMTDEDDAAYDATQTMPKGGFVRTVRLDDESILSTFVFVRYESTDANDLEGIAKYTSLIGILMGDVPRIVEG